MRSRLRELLLSADATLRTQGRELLRALGGPAAMGWRAPRPEWLRLRRWDADSCLRTEVWMHLRDGTMIERRGCAVWLAGFPQHPHFRGQPYLEEVFLGGTPLLWFFLSPQQYRRHEEHQLRYHERLCTCLRYVPTRRIASLLEEFIDDGTQDSQVWTLPFS